MLILSWWSYWRKTEWKIHINFYSFSKALREFFIKISHHACYSIDGIELLRNVRFQDAHRHLNILDLLSHVFVILVNLMKQCLCRLIPWGLLSDFTHDSLEIRVAILIDRIDETKPLLILHSVYSLLRIHGTAHNDVVGEPFLIEAPRIRHKLLALNDHVELRAVRLCTHRLHALLIGFTYNSNDEVHEHDIAY